MYLSSMFCHLIFVSQAYFMDSIIIDLTAPSTLLVGCQLTALVTGGTLFSENLSCQYTTKKLLLG